MSSVSLPPFDAMGLEPALMEVMRGTAVSFPPTIQHTDLVTISRHSFVQFPVRVEHSGAAMASALAPLTAVMGIKIALMAVMKVDVVALPLAALAVSMYLII